MSIHEALVVKIPEIQPHPDPETLRLGIVMIDDYQVVVAKDQWKAGDLAIYIEPDTMVPVDLEEFSFLKKKDTQTHHRIKVIRLRGCYSQGLLVPAPEGSKVGDDFWEKLCLERYEPKVHSGANCSADTAKGPSGIISPKYNLENWRKYGKRMFEHGEPVVITEKIHGCNARFLFHEGEMHCGSRTRWVSKADNVWWTCLEQNPWIEKYCRLNPSHVFYGEIYGNVQSLRYGHGPGEFSFALFDVMDGKTGTYFGATDLIELRSFPDVEVVPVLYVGPYSREVVLEHTDGQTTIKGADHIREGCVVKPAKDGSTRWGRRALKSVSDRYLLKDKG